MRNFDSPDDHTSQFSSSILWPGRSKIEGNYSIVQRRKSKIIYFFKNKNIPSTQTPILEATIERNVDLLTDLLKLKEEDKRLFFIRVSPMGCFVRRSTSRKVFRRYNLASTYRIQNPDLPLAGRGGAAHGGATFGRGGLGQGGAGQRLGGAVHPEHYDLSISTPSMVHNPGYICETPRECVTQTLSNPDDDQLIWPLFGPGC